MALTLTAVAAPKEQKSYPLLYELKGHRGSATCLAFSADGRTLASGSRDWTVRLWDLRTRRTLAQIPGGRNPISSLAFHPRGRLLAFATGGEVRLWDRKTRRTLRTLRADGWAPLSVAFSPDGRLLASSWWNRTIRFWSMPDGRQVRSLHESRGPIGWGSEPAVWSIAFSPDGRLLASGSGEGALRVWEVATGRGRLLRRCVSSPVQSVAFGPSGGLLASAEPLTGAVRLWTMPTGSPSGVKLPGDQTRHVHALAFSPDGSLLATGSYDRTCRLWSLKTGKSVAVLRGHPMWVMSVAFSPDGRLLATGGGNSIRLWSVR
jgi:WD40 repeat protein